MLESNEPKPGSALAHDAARSAKTEQTTKRRADALVHRMLSAPEAADYLGVSTSFLNKSRITGDGFQFHKLGRIDNTDEMHVPEQKLSFWRIA